MGRYRWLMLLALLLRFDVVTAADPSPVRKREEDRPVTAFSMGSREFSISGVFQRERRGKNEGLGSFKLGYGYYLRKNLALRGEWVGYYLRDRGKDGVGAGVNLGFRYHFLATERWSVFVAGTGGFLQASHNFPAGGTRLNFTYGGSIGATIRMQERWHLAGGVGFGHVSNGFMHGRGRNPGSNGFEGFVGLLFAF